MAIEHYEIGIIEIDGRVFTSDVVISPEGVSDSAWRLDGHTLTKESVEPLLRMQPGVLVLGTGADGAVTVPPETVEFMSRLCPEVHVEMTARACMLYNELARGERRVVAALHLED